jgi:formylglycine-generating enzyme required for sulfatase activity
MYDPTACNTSDAGWMQLTDVGGLPNCEGGYDGVFDMSGNVWEWTNSCNGQGECQRRGGSLFSNGPNARCGIDSLRPRDFRADSQGFRCCSSN